ncbi:DNA ligase D [Acuticoccus yangtzensis]|uniref:DNA ligase D n=1 Tax=Acuticoccus yangtzensis TaxID=1443441 RepID=UPI00094978A1|nr:DNA ligase D [Acuticoccus yangtzensis]
MSDRLKAYRDKRDFSVTPEPRAAATRGRRGKGAASFVVQKHAARRLHFDFRLEMDGVLKSWAVTRGPSLDPAEKRLAVETEDHPLSYGGFEGRIPEGEYGGGTVMLWDRGTWAMADGKDAAEGLSAGALTFDLFGERMTGRWHLQRMKAEKGRPPQWLLIKTRDDAADPDRDLIGTATTSVATGRTMKAIAAADSVWHSDRPADDQPEAALTSATATPVPGEAAAGASGGAGSVPRFVPPALCQPRKIPPKGDWLAEVKYDGYRAILRAADGAVTLTTRNENDWTDRFGAIDEAARPLAARGVMLDGEVVVFDADGKTDFGRLQRALRDSGGDGAAYVAFDLLFADGKDWRGEPIEARKAALKRLVGELGGGRGGPIVYGDHLGPGKQEALFERAAAMGLEGIVAKKAGSLYRSGRHGSWVKVRAVRTGDFVVGGYTKGGASGLGALLLGAYRDGRLIPVGRVGTGFNAAESRRLLALLEERERKTSPFAVKPAAPTGAQGKPLFVRPDLVATAEYLTMTDDGQLRHAAYRGLADVDASAVELPSDHPATSTDREPPSNARSRTAAAPAAAPAEQRPRRTRAADGASEDTMGETYGVTLSNPDKVLFADQGITKSGLAAHYAAHMERMLPHIEGRPLTLVRCPHGSGKACFYQRHPEGMPERMGREIGEDGKAIVVSAPEDVMQLVQLGVLEIHLRGARVDRPDRPDRLVFDLDPGEGVGFDAVKDAALTVRERLASLDMTAFLKATGGKGLHVVVPIDRRTGWDEAKAWTRAFAERMSEAEPYRYLITMSKAKRKGRIFIDYLRNDWKASAVAPYSTRARPGAPFALPLSWDELDALSQPQPIHVGQIAEGEPWNELDGVHQSLTAARMRAVGL